MAKLSYLILHGVTKNIKGLSSKIDELKADMDKYFNLLAESKVKAEQRARSWNEKTGRISFRKTEAGRSQKRPKDRKKKGSKGKEQQALVQARRRNPGNSETDSRKTGSWYLLMPRSAPKAGKCRQHQR